MNKNFSRRLIGTLISIIVTLLTFVQHYASAQTQIGDIGFKTNLLAGNIQGYSIVFDCYNCRAASSDSIIIYAKKNNKRIKLLVDDFEGNYVTGVNIKYFLNHPFIYITSEHTHGHLYGELYALDMAHLKAKTVSEIRPNIRIPDSIHYRNNNGIRIDEKNNISDGAYYKSISAANYTYDCKYKLVKIKYNTYQLKPVKASLIREEY